MNTHIGWSDTPAYANFEAVHMRLQELGVRYVRDGLCPTCEEWIERLQRLGAAGIRSDIISTDLVGGSARMEENLTVIRNRLRDAVVSVEAPNEPDQQGDPDWVAKARTLQQQLWMRVKGDSALADLTVLGPALANPASPAALGDLSGFVDRGNTHPYAGGGTPLHNIDEVRRLANLTSGDKQLVATEGGYHSDVGTTSGHYGTSERAIGIYTPRFALEGFRDGFERNYIYQLADPWSNGSGLENAFGLLRSDLSPKPSFLALRNLLRVADGDSAPVVAPGGLRLGLEGAPPDLHQLLLQSADGSYALVLWREVSVWDREAKRDLFPAPAPLEVVLGEPIALAQRFDPVDSDAERQRWSDPRRIPVDLAGAPVVIKLTPPAVATISRFTQTATAGRSCATSRPRLGSGLVKRAQIKKRMGTSHRGPRVASHRSCRTRRLPPTSSQHISR